METDLFLAILTLAGQIPAPELTFGQFNRASSLQPALYSLSEP